MRRVITGHDDDGRSAVVGTGVSPRTTHFKGCPGMSAEVMWATDLAESDTTDNVLDVASLVPGPGGTRLIALTLPPDAVMGTAEFDPELWQSEQIAAFPGLAELFEPESPGTHTTPTIDYVFVLSGRVVLELDNHPNVELVVGDVVVQNATRHAWRNPYDEPARLGVVLVGAASQP